MHQGLSDTLWHLIFQTYKTIYTVVLNINLNLNNLKLTVYVIISVLLIDHRPVCEYPNPIHT